MLRAGQPAVLSCEQLFMRFLDAEMSGTTNELFAYLADDLRHVRVVRLADTSWRARADFDGQLTSVLDTFTARGGRLL